MVAAQAVRKERGEGLPHDRALRDRDRVAPLRVLTPHREGGVRREQLRLDIKRKCAVQDKYPWSVRRKQLRRNAAGKGEAGAAATAPAGPIVAAAAAAAAAATTTSASAAASAAAAAACAAPAAARAALRRRRRVLLVGARAEGLQRREQHGGVRERGQLLVERRDEERA